VRAAWLQVPGDPVRLVAYALIAALALPAVASAEGEPEVAFPKSHAADLLAKSAELAAVKAENTALRAVIDAQQRQLDAQDKLIATQDALLERQGRLTGLADEESKLHEARAARVSAAACGEVRKARAVGYAATAASLGAAAFPPFGIAAGIVGAALGYFLPCP
jgi:hypothetical protein